jgi:alanyl-tRNA synthetase
MDSSQVRKTFLDFFAERGHTVRPSASLIPIDPTLLLTNAGMVPFKPYFLGEETPPYSRAVSVQKSVRTIDIDIIGTTARHTSFFEMMGNFSFGDYFKREAIRWSYELVTEGYGLDPDRLWFTVYETDDEAAALWVSEVGAAPDRVQRGGKDNFWQMGVPGPCGPCSEIFYDRGPAYGAEGGPIGGGEDRYVELWNLVFMQNIQDRPYHVVGDLPRKGVDTGMGLERTAMILQGVDSAFETDVMRPVLEVGSSICEVPYGRDSVSDVSLRILADHGRSMTMLIADGVVPSNEGRGYVLRRLIRRAVRHGWLLGYEGLLMPRLASATVGALGEAYPELIDQYDLILKVVSQEEYRFLRTLQSGYSILQGQMNNLAEGESLSGEVAFRLHDTYGFPFELIMEITEEKEVGVDEGAFQRLMEKQRQRARRAWKGGEESVTADLYRGLLDDIGTCEFVGYDNEETQARVMAILREGEQVSVAQRGETVEVFLDQTPFYAEAGGQVGDSGRIVSNTGELQIADTRHPVVGLSGHQALVTRGWVGTGQRVRADIDSLRREGIRKSHTATHILHWALREGLGDHVRQAGSLVTDGRLRFDFSHYSGLEPQQLFEIDLLTNQKVIGNGGVDTTVMHIDKARASGALAFFGDKYGEQVRVVQIGEFSRELCGGTHVPTSGQTGPVVVLGESSIGANLRRVEALTGQTAYDHLLEVRDTLDRTGKRLAAPWNAVPERVDGLLARVSELEDELETLRSARRGDLAEELAGGAKTHNNYKMVVSAQEGLDVKQLRQLALGVRDRISPGVVIVGGVANGKGAVVGAVSPILVQQGISAGEVVGSAARVMGGGGSRDPELAQGGGPKGHLLDEALEVAGAAAALTLSEV